MAMFNNSQGATIHGGNFNATVNNNNNITHNYHPAPPAKKDAASRVLAALGPSNMRAIHRDKLRNWVELTGEWFIEDELEPWFVSSKKMFWAYGDPGTGKTTLLARSIDTFEKKRARWPEMSACYYYCNHINKTATVEDVLIVYLRQHVERDEDPSFAKEVEKVLKRHRRENVSGLSQSELEQLLKTITKRRPTFYFLDALDEFPAHLKVELLKSLSSLGARLIITSRIDKPMEEKYRVGTTFCKIRARGVDIDRLLDNRIANSPELEGLIGKSHLNEIRGTIKAGCDGMFLHAALQIDALWNCTTIEAARKALEEFPSRINQFYDDGVTRMMSRPETVGTVKLGLVCLLTSFRPLTIQDLQYILAFDPNSSTPFDTSRILHVDTLLSLFRGLVTVDRETQHVGFIHTTAREFLMEYMKDDPLFKQRHDDLAKACIARLKSLDMHRSKINSRDEYNQAMSNQPLLAYADMYWDKHTHASVEPATRQFTLHFIDQCTSYPSARFKGPFDHLSAIHIASQAGFLETVLAAHPAMLSARTSAHQLTPLMLASWNGHGDVVSAILQASVNVNESDSFGFTALMFASQNGHADVVRLLLDAPGILVNQAAEDGWTALMFASQNGHADVVRLLLDAPGILVNQAKEDGWTALMGASQNGHADVVRLLLDAPGILVNQAKENGWMALMSASMNGHADVVRLLLDAPGILVNQAKEDGWTALMGASQDGHADVVRLLLDAPGILVNQAVENGWTALMSASMNGRADVVRLLLDAPGILVNQAAEDGWTALMSASMNGRADVVRLLLDAPGILVNQAAEDGWTALMSASQDGHANVVRLLLDAPGILVNQAVENGWTALTYASLNGHADVVQLLETSRPRRRDQFRRFLFGKKG